MKTIMMSLQVLEVKNGAFQVIVDFRGVWQSSDC